MPGRAVFSPSSNCNLTLPTATYRRAQPFDPTMWLATVCEIVVCALLMMYVEGYGTNEGLPPPSQVPAVAVMVAAAVVVVVVAAAVAAAAA